MKTIHGEILIGHSIDVSDSHYNPKEEENLEDYLKAIDYLTIVSDAITLKKHIQKLEEENKKSKYVIKAELREREDQIKKVEDKLLIYLSNVFRWISRLN